MKLPTIGLNAVVGRVPEEYGIEPTAMSQLRPGNYDIHARVGDMNVNGIAASLNFGSCVTMDGRVLVYAKDKDLALIHLRAWNDWHLHEWCNVYPGRFIPCAILPIWNMDATVAEIKRIARNGYTAVTINDNPTSIGLPGIHEPYWEPFFKAIVDHDMAICLHIGTGNPTPMPTMSTPIEAYITTMPMAISVSAADWLNLEALHRYPTMKIALSEGGIGWIPYFLERADFVHRHHKAWTHSRFRRQLAERGVQAAFPDLLHRRCVRPREHRPHRRGPGRLRMRLSALGQRLARCAGRALEEHQDPERPTDRQGHA